MLRFESYLLRRTQWINQHVCADQPVLMDDKFHLLHADKCFVSIDQPEARELVKPDVTHFVGAILLRDGDEVLMNFDCWDTIIWSTWIQALLDFKQNGSAQVRLADRSLQMEWLPQKDDQLLFRLSYPDRVYAEEVLPRQEFLDVVAKGLIYFYEKEIDHGNVAERNHKTLEFLRALEIK